MASSGASGRPALSEQVLTSFGKKRRADDDDDSYNDGRDDDHRKSPVTMSRESGHSAATSPKSAVTMPHESGHGAVTSPTSPTSGQGTPGQPGGKRAKQAHDPNRSNFGGFGDYIAHKNAGVRQRQAATAPPLESNIFAGVVVSDDVSCAPILFSFNSTHTHTLTHTDTHTRTQQPYKQNTMMWLVTSFMGHRFVHLPKHIKSFMCVCVCVCVCSQTTRPISQAILLLT